MTAQERIKELIGKTCIFKAFGQLYEKSILKLSPSGNYVFIKYGDGSKGWQKVEDFIDHNELQEVLGDGKE